MQLDAARQLDGPELLHTFSTDIASVTLVPGTGGIFTVSVDEALIWERKRDGGFPDAAELKRRVRDVCFPEKRWGMWIMPGSRSKTAGCD